MNKTNSKETLILIFEMQDATNSVVNPNWIEADYPFWRAAYMELVEAVGHTNWKWWKDENADITQLQLELVDVFHFMVSEAISDNHKYESNDYVSEFIDTILGSRVSVVAPDITRCIEALVRLTMKTKECTSDIELFVRTVYASGMTLEDLFNMYIAKNALNNFRYANGYKSGDYVKMWFDGEDSAVEDNVILMRIVSELKDDKSIQDGRDMLVAIRERLEEEYHKRTGKKSVDTNE